MEALRSPPNSPRPRPGGPRTLTRRQTSRSGQPFALSPAATDGGYGHAGHESPAPSLSSTTGSLPSPGAPNFDHVALPPPLRDARDWHEQGVQTSPALEPSRPVSRASTAPAVKVIAKPPTLTPPPALNFESVPVQWRGMTLETAQWTLTSAELQEIVSRAIRRTAQESFIRLLSVKALDEELDAELARLDTAKATAQAKYRFNMHRRTMLLQSLVALSCSEPDCAALASLVTQLAEVTASCDALAMDLLRFVDQREQIRCMQEVHISSALAMALRKLNASYGKRTEELKAAKLQVDSLKAELEEAWKVAQDMAQEMDDLENFHSGFSDESDMEIGDDDTRMEESVRLAEVIGVTGKAVATKATLTQLVTERAKERERNDYENRSQRVSAARKRSSRMSKTSLRLPKSLRGSVPPTPVADNASISSRASRNRSRSLRRSPGAEPGPSSFKPPVPSLQVDTTATKASFLEMAETRPVTPATPLPPSQSPPPPLPGSEAPVPDQSALQSNAHEHNHDHRATFDFVIPPITISPAEGGHEGGSNVRRVHSMQPAPRARSSDPDDGVRRASTEYKRFDGWPFAEPARKNVRRRSMPLTTGFDGADEEFAVPPPRVFSPPPSYSAHPPGSSSRAADAQSVLQNPWDTLAHS
ncbi:hypothetical protein PsYK624_155160 [Phanerochaete sordida]|uniref:Uncharacterized protein n=1 Tax=Phanerochaete sordida TaxID=48140 RepID=A0A9P3GQK1_9APHY|nr:hypothetical protein PsYK624_155160 [Phanerochaete sordida]